MPSPAMVVAVVALSLALGGSAIAGTDAVINKLDKKEKKQVKKIAKKQANKQIRKKAGGLSVANAQNAVNAQNAAVAGDLPDLQFTVPALEDGWVSLNDTPQSFGAGPPGFAKDAQGVVHLRGAVQNPSGGGTVFTLPAGLRPANDTFGVVSCIGGPVGVPIGSNGEVSTFSAGCEDLMILDGVTFAAGA